MNTESFQKNALEDQRDIAFLKARVEGLEKTLAGLAAVLTWQSESGRWWHNFSGLSHFPSKEEAVKDLFLFAQRRTEES